MKVLLGLVFASITTVAYGQVLVGLESGRTWNSLAPNANGVIPQQYLIGGRYLSNSINTGYDGNRVGTNSGIRSGRRILIRSRVSDGSRFLSRLIGTRNIGGYFTNSIGQGNSGRRYLRESITPAAIGSRNFRTATLGSIGYGQGRRFT